MIISCVLDYHNHEDSGSKILSLLPVDDHLGLGRMLC